MNVCKSCAKAARKTWIQKNPEKVAEYNHRNYSNNTDTFRKCNRIKESARRAMIRDQFVERIDPEIVFSTHEGICGICNEAIDGEFHVDHIKPLVLGGLHEYANVQPAHPLCNIRKGARV